LTGSVIEWWLGSEEASGSPSDWVRAVRALWGADYLPIASSGRTASTSRQNMAMATMSLVSSGLR